MRLAPGTRIGPYEIVSAIGAGGMGEVYRARDSRLHRDVALKVLPEIFASDVERLARFDREARALAALNHPHIAGIHGVEESETLRALALEFVDGETLADRIARGPMSLREGDPCRPATCGSTGGSARTRNHSPRSETRQHQNHTGGAGEGPRLWLGQGTRIDQQRIPQTVPTITSASTTMGSILGTPAYMSPEQAKGRLVDKRSDIWAFGCVLFEMLTGHPAFEGDTGTEIIANVLTRQPDWNRLPRRTPAPLRHLIHRCLEKDARQRLRDMGDARVELEEVERQQVGTIPQPDLARTVTARRGLLAATAVLLALAVGGGLWWWSSTSQEAAAKRARAGGARARNLSRVTFSAGLQTHATWSPDGKSLAFASDQGGTFDIWVQRLAGGDAIQLTRSPAADVEPAWSPDARNIVFRSDREGGGLFIVPAVGGPERQLTSFGVKPQWTPDGTEILFRNTRISTMAAAGFDETSGLYAISAFGGDVPRQILPSFLNGGRWPWIASHPDGRISVLGQHPTLGWGFFTLDRDGRQMTRSELAADLPFHLGNSQMSESGTRVMRFQWNALGTALYVEAIVNEVQSIWRVDVQPKTLRWIAAERLTTGSGADANVTVSADGRRLAFTTEHRTSRVWVFPFNPSTGAIGGQGTPVTPESAVVTWGNLAPDGSKVAYVMKRAGSPQSDLWRVNVDGTQRELLAQSVNGGMWAADAKTIAYTLFREEAGEWALAIRALGGPERLLSPWSRDSVFFATDSTRDGTMLLGSYLSPTSAPAVLALWTAAKPSSKPLRVSLEITNASLWQAQFSPDMRWIACVVQRHGSAQGVELVVGRVVDGKMGELTRIAADHVWPDKPKWAPDGRTLYFLSRHDAGDLFDLWGVRFDSERGPATAPFRVSRFDSPSQMISPDLGNTDIGIAERWALLTIETLTGNIWTLDNVGE